MEDIQNIKEEVYKCSKCALCRSVCPVFYAFKNELYLPRGRYNVLNKFFKDGKPLSKKFIKDLDICLNCSACRDFCPSAIDSAEIFTELKSRYKTSFIPFMLKYKLILSVHAVKKHFSSSPLYKVNVKRRNSFLKIPKQVWNDMKFLSSSAAMQIKKGRVMYFQGCFNKYINPSDKNAALNLLEENGFKIIKISGMCCGMPFISDGRLNDFKSNAEKIKKSIPKEADYIAVSCDSCYEMLKKALPDEKRILKIEELINLTELEDAVFHKPFSRKKYEGKLSVINKKYSCSLMENYFMLKHPDLAEKMLDIVFYDKKDIEGKKIITSCSLAKWGLIEGCRKKGINAEIFSEAEYCKYNTSIVS